VEKKRILLPVTAICNIHQEQPTHLERERGLNKNNTNSSFHTLVFVLLTHFREGQIQDEVINYFLNYSVTLDFRFFQQTTIVINIVIIMISTPR